MARVIGGAIPPVVTGLPLDRIIRSGGIDHKPLQPNTQLRGNTMSNDVACTTCRLYSHGYTPEELGLDPEDSTPAIHFTMTDDTSEDPYADAGFGTCDFCGEDSNLIAVHTEPYGVA